MSYTLSQAGADLIKQYEGLSLKAYLDQVGVLTIGYGTTNSVLPANLQFKLGDTITLAQALQYLMIGVNTKAPYVNSYVKSPISQAQFDALISFTYNLGQGALLGSTLLKKVNAGDLAGAQQQFLVWNKAGGKVARGLTRRRLDEATMFGPLSRSQLIAQCLGGIDPNNA